jgi:phosphotransferase system enzyme I (PtsI)
MILQGRTISQGVFVGRALLLDARSRIGAAFDVPARRGPEGEIERLHAALARACAQLEGVEQQLSHHARVEDAQIFMAHLAMMRDPAFLGPIERSIRTDGASAEAAVALATIRLQADFEASAVAMIRDKAPDVIDIGQRLLRCLDPGISSRAHGEEAQVLIASVLTSSRPRSSSALPSGRHVPR